MTENQKVKAGENEEEDETEENADEYDPRTDPEYSKYLKGELKARAAKQDAECFEAERLWTPPPFPASLAEQLAEESPEINWVFKDLQAEGKGMLNAQKKAGKTIVMMNKVRALVTGEPLFDWFEVNVRDDERAGYLNLELQRNQFNFEMKKMDLTSEAQKRIEIYHAIDSGRLDFRNDLEVEWLISWLKNNGIGHLIIDPLSSIFVASEWARDPNDAFNRWWMILEDVYRKANLRSIFMAHHTGVSEEAANRGRGASAVGDKTDMNMSYRYHVEPDGSHTDNPLDTRRYLSAYGRGGVNVNDFEVVFNPFNNRLEATNSGQNRKEAEAEAQAIEMWKKVNDHYKATGEPLNKTQIYNALGWQQKGKAADKYGRFYAYATTRTNWVLITGRTIDGLMHVPGLTPPGCTP